MPGLNGIELARRMRSACPSVKLLALTVHEDRAYVQPLLEAGARGYLLKRSAADDLVRASAPRPYDRRPWRISMTCSPNCTRCWPAMPSRSSSCPTNPATCRSRPGASGRAARR
ncbi:MAG: response regulator transcription factor [Actinobacteria bacterium]|nr:response regulator transcription factor [Actinomycetota bacterium]